MICAAIDTQGIYESMEYLRTFGPSVRPRHAVISAEVRHARPRRRCLRVGAPEAAIGGGGGDRRPSAAAEAIGGGGGGAGGDRGWQSRGVRDHCD